MNRILFLISCVLEYYERKCKCYKILALINTILYLPRVKTKSKTSNFSFFEYKVGIYECGKIIFKKFNLNLNNNFRDIL